MIQTQMKHKSEIIVIIIITILITIVLRLSLIVITLSFYTPRREASPWCFRVLGLRGPHQSSGLLGMGQTCYTSCKCRRHVYDICLSYMYKHVSMYILWYIIIYIHNYIHIYIYNMYIINIHTYNYIWIHWIHRHLYTLLLWHVLGNIYLVYQLFWCEFQPGVFHHWGVLWQEGTGLQKQPDRYLTLHK